MFRIKNFTADVKSDHTVYINSAKLLVVKNMYLKFMYFVYIVHVYAHKFCLVNNYQIVMQVNPT